MSAENGASFRERIRSFMRQTIIDAIVKHESVGEAAKALKLNRSHMYQLMRRLNVPMSIVARRAHRGDWTSIDQREDRRQQRQNVG